jgi:hypothetical protein
MRSESCVLSRRNEATYVSTTKTIHFRAFKMRRFSFEVLVCAAVGLLSSACNEARTAVPPVSATEGHTPAIPVDWKAVEAALGRTGSLQPGDVYRFGLPRGDLSVKAGGVQLRPTFALGSWAAFKAMGDVAVVMGDLVLLEDEVNPVLSKLQEGGIEQTAIHHHILHESPKVLYMHIHGHGDAVKLATTIKDAVALTKTPPPAPAAATPPPIDLDTSAVAATLGHSGKVNGGVYQVSVPRTESIRDNGMEVPSSMGLGTAINFQPTGQGKAAITGDFVLLAAEVNPVIRALRANGIEVTSLHNHMLTEEPRLFFMHFWANDDVEKLARGLRAALDKTNSKKPQ